MHAGEALWSLYAALAAVGQRTLKDQGANALLTHAEECCEVIGKHIQVGPPPMDQKMLRASELVERLVEEQESEKKASTIMGGEARDAFDLATGILADLEDLPEKAEEFVESVGEKVRSMRSYIEDNDRVTAPMLKALQNIRGGVDRWQRK